MAGLSSARVIVAGAGALGATTALFLAREGAEVVVADPAALGANASGVAAGMLAPAFEAVLDEASEGRFPLLAAARDLWPALSESLGDIGLRRSGAVWVDQLAAAPKVGRLDAALASVGAETALWSTDRLRESAPGLALPLGPALFTPEDWRLEPLRTLGVLRREAEALGVRFVEQRVVAFERGRAVLADGEALAADMLVLASGADTAAEAMAPEIAVLSPIKGQLLHFAHARTDDDRPAVRCTPGYAVPSRDGLRIGATMEPGVADDAVDAAALAPLRAFAAELIPAFAGAAFSPRAGVRAATPDGLPLVGASTQEGVFLAVGARRNGWLLAPLVASTIAAYLAGRDPGPHAGSLAARRFA